ncbi:hypothetical protein [Nostoc sp. PCC 9305]
MGNAGCAHSFLDSGRGDGAIASKDCQSSTNNTNKISQTDI